MPKVHFVSKARKTKKRYGIRKGLPYWWWKMRRPGQVAGYRVVSLNPPKPSQLVGSPFMKAVLRIREAVEDIQYNLPASMREAAEELRELGEEQEEKYNNMPESLQGSPTGVLLCERMNQCEQTADELESAAEEIESLETDKEDEDGLASVDPRSIYGSVSWDFS